MRMSCMNLSKNGQIVKAYFLNIDEGIFLTYFYVSLVIWWKFMVSENKKHKILILPSQELCGKALRFLKIKFQCKIAWKKAKNLRCWYTCAKSDCFSNWSTCIYFFCGVLSFAVDDNKNFKFSFIWILKI